MSSGGLVPLAPYMLLPKFDEGFVCLRRDHDFCLGGIRLCEGIFYRRFKDEKCVQTAMVGSLVARVAYPIAKSIA
jgi:hypothetical protein